MPGDGLVDFKSEGEGSETGFGGDTGLRSVADGVEEVEEFEAEGLGAGDVGLGEGEAGGGVLQTLRG